MNGVNEAIDAKLDSLTFIDNVGRRLLQSRSFMKGIADSRPSERQAINMADVRWIISSTIDGELARRDTQLYSIINAEINRVVPQSLANISGVDQVFKKYVQTTTILFTEHANHLAKLGVQERTTTAALMRQDGNKYVQSLVDSKEGGLIVQAIETRVNDNKSIVAPFIISVFAGVCGAYLFKVVSDK